MTMIELDENLVQVFLSKNNLENCQITKVAGDASFRSYYRVFAKDKNFILMFAPPKYEKIEPFIEVDEFLIKNNILAPKIYAKDFENGFLLLQDFGDESLNKFLLKNQNLELEFYKKSVDCLLDLQKKQIPEFLSFYNNAELMREVMLFVDWYLPLKNKTMSLAQKSEFKSEFFTLFDELQNSILTTKTSVILRDYHADNLMVLPNKTIGLLDFQDSLFGSKAYDLVSLIEDARRDISVENRDKIYDYFIEQSRIDEDIFRKEYEILSLQRNIKIIGIFARLYLRDKKNNYLNYLPRVENFIKLRINSSKNLGKISAIIKNFI